MTVADEVHRALKKRFDSKEVEALMGYFGLEGETLGSHELARFFKISTSRMPQFFEFARARLSNLRPKELPQFSRFLKRFAKMEALLVTDAVGFLASSGFAVSTHGLERMIEFLAADGPVEVQPIETRSMIFATGKAKLARQILRDQRNARHNEKVAELRADELKEARRRLRIRRGDRALTIPEAAKNAPVKIRMLYTLIEREELDVVRVGGRMYCRERDVQALEPPPPRPHRNVNAPLARMLRERYGALTELATTPAQLTLAKAVSLLGLTPNEVSRIYTARKRKRLGIDELADGLTVLPAKAHSRVDESRLGVLSVSEAARRLEVSRRTIQDAARAGDLATAAGTNGTYVLDKDLERWWQRHRSNFEARSRSAELKRRWSMDR